MRNINQCRWETVPFFEICGPIVCMYHGRPCNTCTLYSMLTKRQSPTTEGSAVNRRRPILLPTKSPDSNSTRTNQPGSGNDPESTNIIVSMVFLPSLWCVFVVARIDERGWSSIERVGLQMWIICDPVSRFVSSLHQKLCKALTLKCAIFQFF